MALQGEYIAVEKLEMVYQHAPSVEQVWVYGDSFQSSLVAVVVPKKAAVMEWAKTQGKDGSYGDICKDPDAVSWMLSELKTVGKEHRMKGFEFIKALLLEPEAFSIENGFLTPSFKYKRQELKLHYQAQITDMYAKMKSPKGDADRA